MLVLSVFVNIYLLVLSVVSLYCDTVLHCLKRVHVSVACCLQGVRKLKEDKANVCTYLSCQFNDTTCFAHNAARGTTCGDKKVTACGCYLNAQLPSHFFTICGTWTAGIYNQIIRRSVGQPTTPEQHNLGMQFRRLLLFLLMHQTTPSE